MYYVFIFIFLLSGKENTRQSVKANSIPTRQEADSKSKRTTIISKTFSVIFHFA